MDSIDKDYLLDQAMTSVASFAAAGRMTKRKLENLISQPGVGDMTTDEVLKYLIGFMEEESDKMFKLYDQTFKKKVNRDTIYIELIPEAPFNPEDKELTIQILREQCNSKEFSLIQVYDKKYLPKFVTVDEFEKDYYEYWETLMRFWGASEEDIEKFKAGSHDYKLHA
jgi:hypothetical protein